MNQPQSNTSDEPTADRVGRAWGRLGASEWAHFFGIFLGLLALSLWVGGYKLSVPAVLSALVPAVIATYLFRRDRREGG